MYTLKNFKLSRRKMLRGLMGGASVAVGLPLLEAMLDAHGDALADGSALPLRFMTWFWPDGIVIPLWEPAEVGATWSLSEQLAPLVNVKDYVSVITGLRNRCEGPFLTHHEGLTALTGYTMQTGGGGGIYSEAGGPSIDQRIADLLTGCTPIRDVHVRVSKRFSTDPDDGPNAHAISHRGEPGSLVTNYPQENPQDVWDHLFGEFEGGGPNDNPLRLSILDYVKEDVDRLRPSLGMDDRARLDAHLQGVAELEAKISAAPPPCELPALPTETNEDAGGVEPISAVNTAFAELIAYAFSCDLTRVASFMFKRFVSSTIFDEISVGEQHHSASHNGSQDPDYQAGITYIMQKFADVLEIFQGTVDGRGDSLLDTTIIYATSDCSTGSSHSIDRQPIILAGTGRGHLVHPGIHYQATAWNGSNGEPNSTGNMSDVLLSCLRAFDPAADGVGSEGDGPYSNTPLTEVLA
jgi:hypothetical protein